MRFWEEGDEILCYWEPGKNFQGFHDILHGGIQSTMIDEIASWVVFIKLDTAGVTYRLNVKYSRPVRLSKGEVALRAKLREKKRSLALIDVSLSDGEGALCSEGLAEYFIMSPEKAKKELHFPGKDAFYEQEI